MKNLSLETFIYHLENICVNYKEKKFLIAVSGGVDSMVLLDLCISTGLQIEVAHVNYNLRGEDSNLDKELVEKVCFRKKIPLHIYDAHIKDSDKNIQIWAREIRYNFFRQIQIEKNIDFIITAHHLNDQMETFFINLLRGTGIRGLCGIPENQNTILRPLLSFTKNDIYSYANTHKISFREDKSNSKNIYQRNMLRNDILPKLQQMNPNFMDNFLLSVKNINSAKNSLEILIQEKLQSISYKKNNQIIIDKINFCKLENYIKYEILQSFGMNSITEIKKIDNAETGAIFQTNTHNILINRNEIIIAPIVKIEKNSKFIQKNHNNVYKLAEENTGTVFLNTTWFFDASKIKFPLEIRQRKDGDRFQPKGMKGSKLVSKYLKDEKINQFDKENISILCDASGEILGVLPYRQDGRKANIQANDKESIIIIF